MLLLHQIVKWFPHRGKANRASSIEFPWYSGSFFYSRSFFLHGYRIQFFDLRLNRKLFSLVICSIKKPLIWFPVSDFWYCYNSKTSNIIDSPRFSNHFFPITTHFISSRYSIENSMLLFLAIESWYTGKAKLGGISKTSFLKISILHNSLLDLSQKVLNRKLCTCADPFCWEIIVLVAIFIKGIIDYGKHRTKKNKF